MNGELKRKLEHILRTTYPCVEIFLILFFTLFGLAIAFLKARADAKRQEAAAHSKAKATIHGTGAGIELRPRNTVPENRLRPAWRVLACIPFPGRHTDQSSEEWGMESDGISRYPPNFEIPLTPCESAS